jgi:poly-gamma-glutamate synthesis protein (capsule biosynthesis protein)
MRPAPCTEQPGTGSRLVVLAALATVAALAACSSRADTGEPRPQQPSAATRSASPPGPGPTVTLAFAGDVHFQLHLQRLLARPGAGLGRVDRVLAAADVTMVNLESAVTERGTPDPKELETPADRYWFRTSATALEVLASAGVDVVSMANNHGVDYGPVGLRDTLRAARNGPVAVVGVGRDQRAALAPYRTTVRGVELAFLAADGSPREGASRLWEAGPATPGIAAARARTPRALLAAVQAESRRADVVVVYLHWGREGRGCPTGQQRRTAVALAEAGADVVVGSHAHLLQAGGWIGDTYVGYGLGNFVWYHNHQPETGVLRLRVRDGRVVADAWAPARIHLWGLPLPLAGAARSDAVADWRRLRACADLAPEPVTPAG